jgi:hypothetical protein
MKFMPVGNSRFLLAYLLSGSLAMWGQQGLRLEARSGDGAFNDVSRGESSPVSVAVRDSSDRPVPGAKVTFTMPFSGAGAAFQGGSREQTVTVDEMGIARMPSAKPNKEEGRFNIKVKAEAEGGRSGTLVVSQSNTSALTTKGKSSKTALILALVSGGASAAFFVARRGGGSSSTGGGGSTPTSTSLTAGVITVGAPR